MGSWCSNANEDESDQKESFNLDDHNSTNILEFDLHVINAASANRNKIRNALDCNDKDYTQCKSMKRLLEGLKFYSGLKITENANDKKIWNKFINEEYDNLIDDYIHFNNQHSHELERINNDITNKDSGFNECKISDCVFTSRHHNNQPSKTDENTLTPTENFYKMTMDSLHFYLFHCFDVGIRTKKEDNEDKKQPTDKQKEEKKGEYFDSKFSRLNQMILERQHLTKGFDRFSLKKNNKFNIHIENDEQMEDENDGNNTFVDSMYEYLQNNGISKGNIKKLNGLVTREEYETDCIEFDVYFNEPFGNIENAISIECRKGIEQFIKATQISSSSFSVGLRMYYWSYYKNIENIPEEEQLAQRDTSGYSVRDLFIVRKYNSFKEEISYYPYFTFKQYLEEVVVKVNQYINAKIVKKTKAKDTPLFEYYGIKKYSSLGFNHLVSIVLYCDYSDLSGVFSSSCRKVKKFETIKNIKERNAKYYWLSKYLREAVEVYGQCSIGDRNEIWEYVNKLCGPFYSGMSILLNMPGFNIRLCSPTSTSIQIEVAAKFSGPNGIIIMFNHPEYVPPYVYLRGFNVSWLSRYKEEHERLFYGGYYPMKIVSVRVKSTNNNYKKIIQSLAYLDMCISGTSGMDAFKASAHDILVIQNLFSLMLNQKATLTFDKYILDTIHAFIQNKTQITLDIYELNRSNSDIRDLLMYKLKEGTDQRGENDFSNLFRPELLVIFKNVKTVIINTWLNNLNYSISMIGLLSLIESLDKVIVKAWIDEESDDDSSYGYIYYGKEDTWIYKLWQSNKQIIQKQYATKNYTIQIKEVSEYNECWFLINKKMS